MGVVEIIMEDIRKKSLKQGIEQGSYNHTVFVIKKLQTWLMRTLN